nr:hypothetical protein [Ktedonobacterales bacterium]
MQQIRKWLRRGDAAPTVTLPTALDRPFRAIFFDWDGTAVVDRKEDASAFARVAEGLLRQGVWLAVVTGTNFGNINRQLGQVVAPGLRHHLLICTNRGSEVYGFDSTGEAVRRYLRVATSNENQKLDAVTAAVARELHETYGLPVEVIADRLNRRKVDLIPVAEWADPPKARIGELLQAVEGRLNAANVPGGLHGVIQLGERVAQAQGLDARVTSDVKNLEIGLTDKADAVAWLDRELLQPAGIPWHDVLIGGDEFGDIAGFPGSDSRLCAASADAPVVSVGVEPNGVPPGVVALGGGPARFRSLFARQVALH